MDAEEARSRFLELHREYIENEESWSKVRNDLQAAYTEKRSELVDDFTDACDDLNLFCKMI